jgi:hypothetical protein
MTAEWQSAIDGIQLNINFKYQIDTKIQTGKNADSLSMDVEDQKMVEKILSGQKLPSLLKERINW